MYINSAKTAAAISLMYVVYTLSTAIEAALNGIPVSAIWFVLKQPQTLAASTVCLLLGFGLWRQYHWAWWFGFTAAIVQLGRIAELWIYAPTVAIENLLSQAIVVTFLTVLALPNTWRLCVRDYQIRG